MSSSKVHKLVISRTGRRVPAVRTRRARQTR